MLRAVLGSRGLLALRGRRMLAVQTFPVPNMGDSISEGTLLEITKKVGDHVAMEEIIAQIETDKVTVEVRSPAEGKITAIFAGPDDNVLVGANLIEIDVGAAGAVSKASEVDVPVPDAAASAEAAAPAPAPAPSSLPSAAERRMHASGRRSLISFPPRGAAAIAAAAATPPPAAAAASTAAAPAAATAAAPKFGSVFLDELPERFRRKPLSEQEMECIYTGGADYVF